MTFWNQVWLLIRKDLAIERRSMEIIGVTIPFAVSALIAIALAVGIDAALLSRIGPALFWAIVLLFSVLVALRTSASNTAAQQDQIKLLAVDPGVVTVAAGLGTAIVMLVFELFLLPITVLLFNPPAIGWSWLITLPLVALGLGLLGALVNSITARISTRTSLAALLIVPGSVPLLLAGARSLESSNSDQGILAWLLLMLAMDLGFGIAAVALAGPIDDL